MSPTLQRRVVALRPFALGAAALIVGLGASACSGQITGGSTGDPNAVNTLPGTSTTQGSAGAANSSVGSSTGLPTAGGGATASSGGQGSAGSTTTPPTDAPPAPPGPGDTPTIPNIPPPIDMTPADASTTTPPDPPPVDPPPPPPTPICKRGIAMAGSSLTTAALRPGIAWWYNWGPSMQQVTAGVEFVPMIWGNNSSISNAGSKIPAGATYLLGFNEPNFFAQADLSASEAAALWPQVEQVAQSKNLKLVSPAVNFCGDDANKTGPCHDTNPVDYLTDFFAACSGCTVDYVAVHWYNCDTASLTWYLDQFKQFGKPIWLTEFACVYGGDRSPAGQEAYMRKAIPLLDADTDIFRYSWFSGDAIAEAKLVDGSGNLTALGQVYENLPQPNCL